MVSSAAASQASARSREREEPRARGEREEQRARRERDEQRARGVASGVVGGGDTTSPPSAWIVPCAEATRADSRILVSVRYAAGWAREPTRVSSSQVGG